MVIQIQILLILLIGSCAFGAEIHDAAIAGDIGRMQTALAADASIIDTKNTQGCSALYLSLDRGRTRAAIWLLENGASWRTLRNRAAAMAVRADSPRALELMLADGAPSDVKDRQGATPLLQAIRTDRSKMIQPLIANGGDPDATLPDGTPIVVWAAATGQKRAVQALLDRGADATIKDPQDRSALELAGTHGHRETTSLLASELKVTAPGITADSGLSQALASGEAQLWHLGHCGWAIKTSTTLLVFDYQPPRKKPAHPSLASGFLTEAELKDLKVRIFVTHGHGDHFDRAIFALDGQVDDLKYIYGFEPGTPDSGSPRNYSGPAYIFTPPHTSTDIDGIRVETLASNDKGVGFLVSVDGLTIYHAGDHAGWEDGQKAGFTDEIDYLAAKVAKVDLAFLNVTGCHTNGACPLNDSVQYTLTKMSPAVWFPTHAGGQEYLYRQYETTIADLDFPSQMICPEYRGDRWVFANQSVQVP